ncbi:MAG: hypothetical protein CMA86_00435 [Euryarchaeota archaeon]|nr:hypothetical protein [Euryarchaeota archaeon]|tara:strand:+ start:310 stop:627 length:318 start_codon:yes stop_codon:yes gene_type:complete
MAGMSKREGAQRILDARASSAKLRGRTVFGGVAIAIIAIGVGVLTSWHFGLATALLCGLLLQYAIERMGTIIEANIANGLKAMGWKEASELDEEAMEKIQRIANG